jgi:HSP20 family protein
MKEGVVLLKGSYPKVNVYDFENKLHLDVYVPELPKEKVMVEVVDGTFTIKGGSNQDKDVSEGDYYVREVSRRAFTRTLKLPDGLNMDAIEAKLKDGMLRVKIPFLAPRSDGVVRRIEIGE